MNLARLNLPSTDPSMNIDDLIFFDIFGGIVYAFAFEASITSVLPSLFTEHPSVLNISIIFSASEISGQSWITTSLSFRILAANIGSNAFFAPLTAISPERLLPPVIT